MTRFLVILAAAVLPALAQLPTVQIRNVTRPESKYFQIGDHFQIVLTAAPKQPVSLRTTRRGRTDWGPVIGATGADGQWSTAGQFDRNDFGDWSEVWTVGGKLANPALNFSVGAPCLEGGVGFATALGVRRGISETCDTAAGRQTFVTPSDGASFVTPDGRLAATATPDEYRVEILTSLLTSRDVPYQGFIERGDAEAALIQKVIGVNALSDDQKRSVLAIVRAAFDRPDRLPPAAADPAHTFALLQTLSGVTDQQDLKQQIADTITWVRNR